MSSSPIFSRVKAQYAKTSLFNLGHELKLTTKIGQLTPILCKEVLPGDTWRVNSEILVRLAPMVAPIMHQVKVYTHFFFVPYRLLWDNWESFITQSNNGKYDTSNIPSRLPLLNLDLPWKNGSLLDYLGVQSDHTLDGSGVIDGFVNSLPFYAYQKIWSDYYRDENLDVDDFVTAPDSPEQVSDYGDYPLIMRYRAWKKDYFTSALPFVQKGPDITLPLGGTAPVTSDGSVNVITDFNSLSFNGPNRTSGFANVRFDLEPNSATLGYLDSGVDPPVNVNKLSGTMNTHFRGSNQIGSVDLSSATAVTINELRRANALQRWEELNARGGTRYIEQLASHFNVIPQDARLQRVQFLGGGVSDVVISEVLQNSATQSDGTPQGTMAGHGLSASFNHDCKFFAPEHGLIMGIMSIMPRAEYYQGCDRMFLKRSYLDFGWPSLAHLGEQPIFSSELYSQSVPEDPEVSDDVFGYTPRYAEYKFSNDRICGQFRGSMEMWHMGRKFSNQPQLNSQFISTENFSPGVFATDEDDPLWCQLYLDCKVTRKLPKFGTPRL